jgi:6-phosphogluconolactonase (cycloisomerase 2 family)
VDICGDPTGSSATAVGPGSTNLTATLSAVNGAAAVAVIAPSPIEISPLSATVAQGMTLQFTGTGVYSDGSTLNLTTRVTWSSSSGSVATISNTSPTQGLAAVTGSSGATNICAKESTAWGSAEACTVLTGAPGVVSLISVTPANSTLPQGKQQQFTATGTLSKGGSGNETSSAIWSSSNSAVATMVPNTGLSTALNIGTTTITATIGSATNSTTFTVTNPVPVSLAVEPAISFVASGAAQQLRVIAKLTNGDTQDETAAATWSSSNSSVATVSNTTGSQGVVTPAGAGSASLTATLETLSNSATVIVNSATPPVFPRFAYMVGNSDNTVSTYAVDAATGQLRAHGYVEESSGSGPCDVALDASSKFLFVLNCSGNSLSVYTVNAANGALTPVAGSPYAIGGGAVAVVVDPTANYVYALANKSLYSFAFDPASGALTAVPGQPFITNGYAYFPGGTALAVDPRGRFLYVLDAQNDFFPGMVSAFTIDSANGVLTQISGSAFTVPGAYAGVGGVDRRPLRTICVHNGS